MVVQNGGRAKGFAHPDRPTLPSAAGLGALFSFVEPLSKLARRQMVKTPVAHANAIDPAVTPILTARPVEIANIAFRRGLLGGVVGQRGATGNSGGAYATAFPESRGGGCLGAHDGKELVHIAHEVRPTLLDSDIAGFSASLRLWRLPIRNPPVGQSPYRGRISRDRGGRRLGEAPSECPNEDQRRCSGRDRTTRQAP